MLQNVQPRKRKPLQGKKSAAKMLKRYDVMPLGLARPVATSQDARPAANGGYKPDVKARAKAFF
jgi:hypothetical protein